MSFLLAMLKLQAVTTFRATPARVEFQTGSLLGVHSLSVPVRQVASVAYGHGRDWYWAVLAFLFSCVELFLLVGAATARSGQGELVVILFLNTLVLAVFVAAFFLSKTMSLSVETTGGTAIAVRFKSSVIEGVSADLTTLKKAVDVVLTNLGALPGEHSNTGVRSGSGQVAGIS